MIRRIAIAIALAVFAAPAAALRAQGSGASGADPAAIADVPFGLGEKAIYDVKLGAFGVGQGSMEVAGLQTVRGRPTYHLKFNIKGGIPFAKVDDRYQSWLDVSRLASRRFVQDQNEVKYKRYRIFDFYPEERVWRRPDRRDGQSGPMPTDLPLDDVSFMYFVRTIPLEVGRTYSYNRYFQQDGNPVTLRVLRRETIKVPAGTFRTIVVQPIIRTDGLFGEGGKAELYFSDDARRVLVLLRSDVPTFPGTLTLHLKSYTPGRQLTARELRAEAR